MNVKLIAAIVIVGSSVLFSANNADGQIVPRATPTPGNVPLIISRAEDFPDENAVPAVEQPAVQPETQESLRDRIDLRLADEQKSANYEERQRRLLLNLDILTRSEQRADALRRQLFEMMQKENDVRTKLDQLDYESRPESIDKGVSFAGTLRPEELREMRAKSLAGEKANLQNLLSEIQKAKTSVTLNLDRADALVEKLRVKLEQEIDKAFAADDTDQ